jgi:hypothetical protein
LKMARNNEIWIAASPDSKSLPRMVGRMSAGAETMNFYR